MDEAVPPPAGDDPTAPAAGSGEDAASPEEGHATPPSRTGRVRRWLALGVEAALLCLVLGAAIEGHLWWIAHSHVEPTGDHAYHLTQEAAFRRVLGTPGLPEEKARTLVAWPGGYPPAVYAWSALFRPPARVGDDPTLASFVLYIVLLGLGAHALGRRLAGPAAGVAAAALALSDASTIACEHSYYLDMPQAAVIVASLAVLAATEDFSRWRPSLLLGVMLGVGMLTKPTFSWYLALPVAGVAAVPAGRWLAASRWGPRLLFSGLLLAAPMVFTRLYRWRDALDRIPSVPDTCVPATEFEPAAAWIAFVAAGLIMGLGFLRGTGRRLLACLLVAGGLCGPWLISNAPILHARYSAYIEGRQGGLEALPRTLALFQGQIAAPVLVLAVLGAVGCMLVRSRRGIGGIVLLSVVPGLLWTLLSLGHTPRYLVPANVLLAVLAVAWLPRRFALPWLALPVFLAWASVNLVGAHVMEPSTPGYAAFARLSALTLRTVADDLPDPESLGERGALALVEGLGPEVRRLAVIEVRGEGEERIAFTDLAMQMQAWARWKGRPVLVEAMRDIEGGNLGSYNIEERGREREQMLARWRGEPDIGYQALPRYRPDGVIFADRVPDAAERVLRTFGAGYRPGPPEHPRFMCFWLERSPRTAPAATPGP